MTNTYDLKTLRQLIMPQCQIKVLDKIPSTQLLAKKLVINNSVRKLSAYIAEEQTNGQGRFGREFFSPAMTGIYFSLVIPMKVKDGGLLTTGLSVTIANVIEQFYLDKEIKLKWVNDLYLDGKKVGGILVEQVKGMIVCGIGLNLMTNNFPGKLNEKATALDSNHSVDIDRNLMVATLINRILHDIPHYKERRHLLAYRQRSLLLGKRVTVKIKDDLVVDGIAKEINEKGALVIKTLNRKITLVSGEVTKVRLK